jgi:hypothetical protein
MTRKLIWMAPLIPLVGIVGALADLTAMQTWGLVLATVTANVLGWVEGRFE